MASIKNYRKANGQRVEGHSLAVRIAQEIKGFLLAHAFVVTKSAGFKFRVNKLDGVTLTAASEELREVVAVDVVNGIVRKSWIDQP